VKEKETGSYLGLRVGVGERSAQDYQEFNGTRAEKHNVSCISEVGPLEKERVWMEVNCRAKEGLWRRELKTLQPKGKERVRAMRVEGLFGGYALAGAAGRETRS